MRNLSEYETILWDLDGTLLDSFGVYQEVLAEVLPKHDLQIPTEAVLRNNFHGSLDDSISNALGGLNEAQLAAVVEGFLEVQNDHYEVVEHHLFDDALQLARKLGALGAFQVIVTNRAHIGRLNASPRSIVENSSLKALIGRVICGDDSEHRKPHVAVVDDLIQEGELVPNKTLVIGDQFVDALFARNLGADAVVVQRHEELAHLDQLGDGWQKHVTILQNLAEIR